MTIENNVDEFLKSKRFIRATANRTFTDDEYTEICKLYNYVITNHNLLTSYNTICQLLTYDTNDLIHRYKFLIANSTRRTKETYIARYGITEGNIRWDQYCNKQKVKNLYETKKEKYGWTEEQFNEFNKSRAVTLAKCLERHGVEKGHEIWNNYLHRQAYTNSIEYFNEKYGGKGAEKWIAYNKEKGKSSDISWIMKNNSCDMDEALRILSNRKSVECVSESELNFVSILELELGKSIKYTANTRQFCIWNKYINCPVFYDITEPETFKIIEFHGDYWHCNPLKYDSRFIVKQSGKTANEIWNYDYLKIKSAIDRGFEVKVVWESEFIANPDKIIKECSVWLNTALVK